VFPMIFHNWMGQGKSKCDIPNGTTQGWVWLINPSYVCRFKIVAVMIN